MCDGGSLVSLSSGTWSPLSQKPRNGRQSIAQLSPSAQGTGWGDVGTLPAEADWLGWAQEGRKAWLRRSRAKSEATSMLAARALPTSVLFVPRRKEPNHALERELVTVLVASSF